MRTLAHLYAFNEVDIIGWTLRHLIRQGVDVIVSDNWSTDGTAELVRDWARHDLRISLRRWPQAGPAARVSLHTMLTDLQGWISDHARAEGYGWIVYQDADEIRRSARAGERLSEALARLDAAGATAVDHALEVYQPREGYDGSQDPETYFTERVEAHLDHRLPHVKAWKVGTQAIDLASTGGHVVQFEGLAVPEERLVLKHYPLRTAAQAARKLAARRARWAEEDRARGWHQQYEGVHIVTTGGA